MNTKPRMAEKNMLWTMVCEQNGDRSKINIHRLIIRACTEKLIRVLERETQQKKSSEFNIIVYMLYLILTHQIGNKLEMIAIDRTRETEMTKRVLEST